MQVVELRTLPWQERVKAIEKHQEEFDLSLRELAEELNCSIGKLSYELTLADALDKFPELQKIKHLTAAIRFIKRKKFRRNLDE